MEVSLLQCLADDQGSAVTVALWIFVFIAPYRDYRLEQGLIETFGLQDAQVLLTTAELRDEQML